MQTVTNKSKENTLAAKPVAGKAPDIASVSVPDTLASLHVNPETGLTRAEVDTRRKENGYNEVVEQKGHPVRDFLRKFWGISAWMLELIMVLSAALGEYTDLAIVSALLIANAVISFAQERRAAGVVETLRKQLQVSARVRRDASGQVMPARELVPGDIVRVRPGDILPADVKLLTGTLSVDQSALTGESKDIDKKPSDVLSSGSIVRQGEGNGVLMLTGAKTYFGRSTELVQQARLKLHIEAVVAKIVRWLFVIVGVLVVVVVVMALIRGVPLVEMITLMLVLLMSAVPVALPVMFTVSMAVGSKELAKRGVLVTRLSAAEDAATMDVLCVDKTGTITMNKLVVTGVIPLEKATESDVLFAGALALLWICWSRFGLATNDNALYTFSFLTLLYFAVFSIVSARERRWFWSTMPSKTLMAALAADAPTGTVLTFVGIPGLAPLPWWQMLVIFAYAMVVCLAVNDPVKVVLIKWRIPSAEAKTPVGLTSKTIKRAYELYEQHGHQVGHANQDWAQAEQEIQKDESHH